MVAGAVLRSKGESSVYLKKKNGENIRGDENDSTKRGKIILKR